MHFRALNTLHKKMKRSIEYFISKCDQTAVFVELVNEMTSLYISGNPAGT